MSSLTKWADTLDRDNAALLATQTAQQRAIDELARRLATVEERLKRAG